MPELAAPWALLGLALIPLIRWLHLFRLQGPPVAVSALFLWQALVGDQRGAARNPRPEPQWWWRAGIATLLVLALADPRLPASAPATEVWWDDAPSMQAVEQGRTRDAAAIEGLLAAAAGTGVAALDLHSLRGGGSMLALRDADRAGWQDAIARWLDGLAAADHARSAPHPLPNLDPQRVHWLVSDGASADLAAWAASQPLNRVIAVGAATENLALTRLAVRAAPGRGPGGAGLVLVHNAGRHNAPAEIEIVAGERVLHRTRLDLAPDSTVQVAFRVAGEPRDIEARLRRLDATPEALTGDDSLRLTLASFTRPIGVLVTGHCPAAVERALSAHPGLVRVTAPAASPAQLQIACTEQAPPGGPPLLWLPTASGSTLVASGDAYWLDGAAGGDARLPITTQVRVLAPPGQAAGRTLLAIDGRPLAVLQSGARPAVTLLLDPGDGPFAGSAAFARLFAGLTERLLDRDLLVAVAATARPRSSSNIAPGMLATRAGGAAVRPAQASASMTAWLLWPAALLLAWDLSAVARRRPLAATTAGR
ncbi:MAG: BatA domain-containing protein [Chromatiaceae bacterium]|nr:BatA domain-containing protein [Chromatiaceae bacterium]